jgi:hypothetical protein
MGLLLLSDARTKTESLQKESFCSIDVLRDCVNREIAVVEKFFRKKGICGCMSYIIAVEDHSTLTGCNGIRSA